MAVDQSEILKKAVAILEVDADLLVLLGEKEADKARVWNHVPQDEVTPYVVVKWEGRGPYDTKDSRGFNGSLEHEIVSGHHGDKEVLQVVDAIIAAYAANPINLVAGRIVCFDPGNVSVVAQVSETHRAVLLFDVLVDADGVGGVPSTPLAGGLIVVQDEGVDLDETPHRKLNFVGDGVTAEDAGGEVATITIPGGGGGGEMILELRFSVIGFDTFFPTVVAALNAVSKDVNALEYLQAAQRSIRSGSILAESGFTVTDPFGLISSQVFGDFAVAFGETVRGVTITPSGIGNPGESADIEWTWNTVPVRVRVTV